MRELHQKAKKEDKAAVQEAMEFFEKRVESKVPLAKGVGVSGRHQDRIPVSVSMGSSNLKLKKVNAKEQLKNNKTTHLL